jgi:D-alanyl-D-alanine carboxypeptidase
MIKAVPPRLLGVVTGVVLACTACAATATSPTSPISPANPPSATASPAKALPADLVTRIDRRGAATLGNGITGAIVSIVDPARGNLLKAYGTADTAGTPMTPDVHYRIASVSKTFTADAVLELAGQGRLSLDDPLTRYVPDIPNGDRITVRDLLGMRAGVYNFTADPGFLARYEADPTLPGWTPDDVLRIIRAHPDKAVAPRTRTVYSNSEYILLGYVLQKAAGQNAPEYLTGLARRRGLPSTSFPTDTTLPSPFSHGYSATDQPPTTSSTTPGSTAEANPPRDATASNPLVPWTAGALISTVPDMTRYAPLLATGAGLPPQIAAQRQSWTPLTPTGLRVQYGLGITQLGDWVGHDGSILGYSDMVFYLPAQNATVVVMVNAADDNEAPAQALWGDLVKLLYPNSLPQWP